MFSHGYFICHLLCPFSAKVKCIFQNYPVSEVGSTDHHLLFSSHNSMFVRVYIKKGEV